MTVLDGWEISIRCPFKSCDWHDNDMGCMIYESVLMYGIGENGVCPYYESKNGRFLLISLVLNGLLTQLRRAIIQRSPTAEGASSIPTLIRIPNPMTD